MPSISLFFRFLDVRGSRGALRPCLGGPSALPKHILGSRAKHILQLVFAEIFFSGVPQRASLMKLLLPPLLTQPPPPRVSRPCPSVLPPLCIAALRTACPRGGPRSDAARQTATVIHHFPGPRGYHSFAREGVRQGARGNYPCEFRVSTGRAPSPPSSTFAARGAALHGQPPRFSFSMISPSNFVEERAPRLSAMGGRAGCNPDNPLELTTKCRLLAARGSKNAQFLAPQAACYFAPWALDIDIEYKPHSGRLPTEPTASRTGNGHTKSQAGHAWESCLVLSS